MPKSLWELEKHFGDQLIFAIFYFHKDNFEEKYKAQMKNRIFDKSNKRWSQTEEIIKSRKQRKKRDNKERFISKIVSILYDFQLTNHLGRLFGLKSSLDTVIKIIKDDISCFTDEKAIYLNVVNHAEGVKNSVENLTKGIPFNSNTNFYYNFSRLPFLIADTTKKYYPHKYFKTTENIINLFIGEDLKRHRVKDSSIERSYRRRRGLEKKNIQKKLNELKKILRSKIV